MNHFLKLEGMPRSVGDDILKMARDFKATRGHHRIQPLAGQTWCMIFGKPSTRTRVSFDVAVSELGGRVFFLSYQEIQLGRGEPIIDTARVLARMLHGAIIRTYSQKDIEDFAAYSGIPTINALSDDEHPCQIMADILTFEEKRGSIRGKRVAFIGDAACNVARSWVYAAEIFDFQLALAAPEGFQSEVTNSHTELHSDPAAAARDADLVYTDVWVSMGKENEQADRLKAFEGYQVNEALMSHARPDALALHCLPAYRDKEISASLLEARATDIFDQAENRMHVQKSILNYCSVTL